MRLADRLGKQLHQLLGWPGPMTHRQFRAWQLWLEVDDKNQPSRADWYMMELMAVLAQVHAEKGKRFRPEDFRMTFSVAKAKRRRSKEEQLLHSKAAWFGLLGMPLPEGEFGEPSLEDQFRMAEEQAAAERGDHVSKVRPEDARTMWDAQRSDGQDGSGGRTVEPQR